MVFQGYALFPHSDGGGQHRLPAAGAPPAAQRGRGTRRTDAWLVHLSRAGGPPAARAVGRPAAARGARPRPGLHARPAAARRAAERARQEAARELQDELRRLHRRVGTTFIYVTHDQEEALSMSDRDRHPARRQADADRLADASSTSGRARASSPTSSATAISCADRSKCSTARRSSIAVGDHRFVQHGSGNRPAAGAAVTFALRPERIKLTTEPAQRQRQRRARPASTARFSTGRTSISC